MKQLGPMTVLPLLSGILPSSSGRYGEPRMAVSATVAVGSTTTGPRAATGTPAG
jgi:hypothetical protein